MYILGLIHTINVVPIDMDFFHSPDGQFLSSDEFVVPNRTPKRAKPFDESSEFLELDHGTGCANICFPVLYERTRLACTAAIEDKLFCIEEKAKVYCNKVKT